MLTSFTFQRAFPFLNYSLCNLMWHQASISFSD
ncbi:hypothetical protein OnM2_016066 [Erysiphe neolycopersici]|uniref:Uncharacterized protein n=1 Tax=Erysiphe neolycopersici TaxID=212602 RepID=A0A420I553_9PEZI|nr:hypothetical protein OnM2_016066 [Erysiphe neolycopersici]